jgi:hypothetical protein
VLPSSETIFESGKIEEVQNVLAETGMHILDGESIEFSELALPAFAVSAEGLTGKC